MVQIREKIHAFFTSIFFFCEVAYYLYVENEKLETCVF